MLNLQEGGIIILHSAATPTWYVGCRTGALATYYIISVVVVSWRVPHDRDTYHRAPSSNGGAVAQYAIVRLSQPVWISSNELMKRSQIVDRWRGVLNSYSDCFFEFEPISLWHGTMDVCSRVSQARSGCDPMDRAAGSVVTSTTAHACVYVLCVGLGEHKRVDMSAGDPSGPGVEDEPTGREMGLRRRWRRKSSKHVKASKSAGRDSDHEIVRWFINPCKATPSQLPVQSTRSETVLSDKFYL
ncbi:hypothetical protein EDD16DRAFT_880344 [Pisolithus croceorrhizus]|nr:hypothetical protein EV401DRAFT_622073 [Pisolithus croceorrhizus]KAI6120427.1 hypothetical protein EDD16DRAFT_880344 [Pisolithus croceorrhizus]KAI6168428.1 hypothetical protein EDD17DRAFT_622320 [Pisolithus thermaeus]